MNAVKAQWSKLNERYLSLSRRERGLLAGSLIFVPMLMMNILVLDPQQARIKQAEANAVQQSVSLTEMRAQVASLQQQLRTDPDAVAKAELAKLEAERQAYDEQLREIGTTLVSPEEMNALLEGLLSGHKGLQLVSLKTLAPTSILADKALTEKSDSQRKDADGKIVARKFDLYKHGVEIRLEGGFADLQAYLSQLEKIKQGLLWGSLQYKVLTYPRAEMSIMVYTLSPDRAWLAL